jgi:hypothetical protein
VLEATDIENLELGHPIGQTVAILPDGSSSDILIYGQVRVSLTFDDGSTCSASILASCIPRKQALAEVGIIGTERILGYNALELLNLKLDFKGHQLIRRSGMRRL